MLGQRRRQLRLRSGLPCRICGDDGGELQLDSWVTAHLVDGSSHRGVLHTVDPETGTVILLKPEGVSALHRTVVRAAVLTWLSSGVRSPIQTS